MVVQPAVGTRRADNRGVASHLTLMAQMASNTSSFPRQPVDVRGRLHVGGSWLRRRVSRATGAGPASSSSLSTVFSRSRIYSINEGLMFRKRTEEGVWRYCVDV